MNRGNTLINTIAKLNTFVLMAKSNELLNDYINKIQNKKCKTIKFANDFDSISLDLLYTSLQIMNNSDKITSKEFNKIDKKELKYYIEKAKGMTFFKKQVPSIKTEENLISYIKTALSNGEYVCNNNNTIKFDNGLVVNSEWLVNFSSFLITSFNNNENVSLDGKTFSIKTVNIPESKDLKVRQFIKDIKLYEYNVTRKDNKVLSAQNVKYLIDMLSVIEEYDFKKLQEINSVLAKENYSLSINKINVNFKKEEKTKIEKLLNEDLEEQDSLNEFIKETLGCFNSKSKINKRCLIDTYEQLRGIARAYKANYSLEECRSSFDYEDKKEEFSNAISIASFYINYIYDETNLHSNFNYESLDFDNLKPSIIDYETTEYKNIIKELSLLNKKVVSENRKINKLLDASRHINKKNKELRDENSKKLSESCKELERLVREIKDLREELNNAKDSNRHKSNINKTKVNYIKEAIINGRYNYDKSNKILVFDSYSKKDYHHTFHLEITLNEFIENLLSDYNRNLRINFYKIEKEYED